MLTVAGPHQQPINAKERCSQWQGPTSSPSTPRSDAHSGRAPPAARLCQAAMLTESSGRAAGRSHRLPLPSELCLPRMRRVHRSSAFQPGRKTVLLNQLLGPIQNNIGAFFFFFFFFHEHFPQIKKSERSCFLGEASDFWASALFKAQRPQEKGYTSRELGLNFQGYGPCRCLAREKESTQTQKVSRSRRREGMHCVCLPATACCTSAPQPRRPALVLLSGDSQVLFWIHHQAGARPAHGSEESCQPLT